MARREAVAALRLLARALVLRRAPAHEWSPDDRITLDAFLRTPTGGRFYDALALLAVTAALRGVEERPFEAEVTAGMGRVVREIDAMRGGEKRGEDGSTHSFWRSTNTVQLVVVPIERLTDTHGVKYLLPVFTRDCLSSIPVFRSKSTKTSSVSVIILSSVTVPIGRS
jgi:hypothetical protein